MFQDNFDYLDIRRDFVHGILTSDLLAKTIHCHVIKDGYAARVRDGKSYDTIRCALMARLDKARIHTIIPVKTYSHDGHIHSSQMRITPVGRHMNIDEETCMFHQTEHPLNCPSRQIFPISTTSTHPPCASSCKIGRNTLLGEDTRVEENAQVSGSVLGPGCVIGAGAVVLGSYLWDGTTVEENCVIEQSIIGKSVTVLKGSRIDRGCIVGDGVKLGPQAKLPEFSRVALEEPEEGGGALSLNIPHFLSFNYLL